MESFFCRQERGCGVNAEGIEVVVKVILASLFLMLVIWLCSLVYGLNSGAQLVRAEAVERGFAEWVPDKEGNTTFKWKEVVP